MRLVVNLGGEAVGAPRPPGPSPPRPSPAEADGFDEAWSVHFSRSSDALASLAAAAVLTDAIRLGGVVPTYPRHPAALAQSALTLQSLVDAGATDVWVVPFDTGADADATVTMLRELAAA